MQDPTSNTSVASKTVNLQSAQQSSTDGATPDALKKSLPHAMDVEKRLLSSMIQDPREYIGSAITLGLKKEHFYKPSHAILYDLIFEMEDKGEPVDLVILTEKLRSRDLLENIGGVAELTDIATCETLHANFEAYLELVKNKAVLRQVIHICSYSITDAYSDPDDIEEFLDTFEQKVFEIKENEGAAKDDAMAADFLPEISEQLEALASGQTDELEGLDCGFHVLNTLSNGLKPGEMLIIAARPSMGKTSFMMNIVEHVAVTNREPTLVFSCEMPSKSIVQRLLFSRAGIPMSKLRPGLQLNKQQVIEFRNAVKDIEEAPLYIDDTPSLSIADLRAKARRRKKDSDIKLIAVDYLQLMRSTSKQASGSREREIAEISAGLKAVAKELEVPIIVLAQLNRGPENRGGKPKMSDLRESGAIEQDADMIGLLFRKAYYKEGDEKENDNGDSELVLAKNRNGETRSVYLNFQGNLMKFVHRERTEEDDE